MKTVLLVKQIRRNIVLVLKLTRNQIYTILTYFEIELFVAIYCRLAENNVLSRGVFIDAF